MRRMANWPEKLAEAVENARPFGGDYFCVTFVADCVLAMTGVDPMEGFRDMTRAEAEAELEARGFDLPSYLAQIFGEPLHVSRARRGDVVLRADSDAVGVCLGEMTAFATSAGGVSFLPTLEQRSAYRVG